MVKMKTMVVCRIWAIWLFFETLPELRQKKNFVANVSSFFFSDHFPPTRPSVQIDSANDSPVAPELLETLESIQSFSLTSNPGNNVFADPSSIADCIELLDTFAGAVLRRGDKVWLYTTFL